jgi:hypothetical protein
VTHRTEIGSHFVDSITLCGSVSVLGGFGVLKKLGIECNGTADNRIVLTDKTLLQRTKCKSLPRHGLGSLGSVSECGRGGLLFEIEKVTRVCCVGLMIKFNISDK